MPHPSDIIREALRKEGFKGHSVDKTKRLVRVPLSGNIVPLHKLIAQHGLLGGEFGRAVAKFIRGLQLPATHSVNVTEGIVASVRAAGKETRSVIDAFGRERDVQEPLRLEQQMEVRIQLKKL